MPFVIIDRSLAIKRMGVSVIVCDKKEEPLGKVVPGRLDEVLTLLTKDQKGKIISYDFSTKSDDMSASYKDSEYRRFSF